MGPFTPTLAPAFQLHLEAACQPPAATWASPLDVGPLGGGSEYLSEPVCVSAAARRSCAGQGRAGVMDGRLPLPCCADSRCIRVLSFNVLPVPFTPARLQGFNPDPFPLPGCPMARDTSVVFRYARAGRVRCGGAGAGRWGKEEGSRTTRHAARTAALAGGFPPACHLPSTISPPAPYPSPCRWYSGEGVGLLTASSCGLTTGDAVVSVLSSPHEAGGDWVCEGGSDDAYACASNSWATGAFELTVPFAPQR